MSNKVNSKKTKSKKEIIKSEKEQAIEQARNAENFLPLYSDCYFAKKKRTGSMGLTVSIYAGILFGMLSFASKFKFTLAVVLLILSVVVALYQIFLARYIMDWRKVPGTKLQPDGAIKRSMFGMERKISYSDLQQDISNGHMCYGDTAIQVGKGKNKLFFHYEIGDSIAQKHVNLCYRVLQKYITVKLLPFEKSGLELLDKKYYYDKNRKKQTISLCIALLLFYVYVGGGGLKTVENAIFCTLIFVPWECFSLYVLSKNAFLTKANHEKLQKFLNTCQDVKLKGNLKGKYSGWVRFILMAMLVIAGNSFIILAL